MPTTMMANNPRNLTKVSKFCVHLPARTPSKLMPLSTTTAPTA